MTAHAMKGYQQRCLAAGMNAYVAKPLNAGELLATIARLQPAHASHHKKSPRAAGRSDAVFSLERAMESLAGQAGLFQAMVAQWFCDWPALNAQMQAALQENDAHAVARAAHRLKSTVMYLGAEPALEAASRVEQIGNSGDLAGAARSIQCLEHEAARLSEALAPHRQSQCPS
jgi:protein-histidine pros-kinase